MQCPFDASTLQAVNRSGIDIDWCPSCKGVWLERGELDKLIDHAAATPATSEAFRPPSPAAAASYDRSRDERDDRDRNPRAKRKNALAELFDF